MILYHPGYDTHHCSYRLLNILDSVAENKLPIDSLKIIDFYYLYPHLLKNISPLPKQLNSKKIVINNIEDPFELIGNPKSLYFELQKIQESTVTFLKNKSMLIKKDNIIELNKSQLPDALAQQFNCDEFRKSPIFSILVEKIPTINLDGKNGLKARSGLMEYRYG